MNFASIPAPTRKLTTKPVTRKVTQLYANLHCFIILTKRTGITDTFSMPEQGWACTKNGLLIIQVFETLYFKFIKLT